jgi:hypothetical protein
MSQSSIGGNFILPVGYTSLEDVYRDEQVKGLIELKHSFTIRPLIIESKNSLNSIENDQYFSKKIINYKKSQISLLPINILQKYNSHHPYGWNDGPLSFSKGYQYLISTGFYFKSKRLHLILRPEFYKTASDQYKTNSQWGQVTNSLTKIGYGQSVIRYDLGSLSFSASTQNLWLGPGIHSSLIMSNNAKGFKYLSFETNKPIKTKLGQFEYLLFSGTLTTLSDQGFENANLKTKIFDGRLRYINGLSVVFSPKLLNGFYFGFNRVFQTYYTSLESTKGGLYKYAMVFNGLFKTSYNDDKLNRDQLLSLYTRWVMPKERAEIYFEYGYNDAKSNTRDLILDNSHASASLFGLRKFFKINDKNDNLLIEAEATRMAQTPSYLQRSAGNWYNHSEVKQGYTNNNQIMGAGSGLGNNLQTFAISWTKNWNKLGIQYQRINQNPGQFFGNANNLFIRDVLWNDYSFGIIGRYKHKKIYLNGSIESVKSKNYLWVNGSNVNNVYFNLSSIISL